MSIQVSAPVSDDLNGRIEAFSAENDCSKSEAIRQLLEQVLETDSLRNENRRLKDQLASTNQRIDETNELVEYVQEERELQRSRRDLEERRAKASVFMRAKWWLEGMPDEKETGDD